METLPDELNCLIISQLRDVESITSVLDTCTNLQRVGQDIITTVTSDTPLTIDQALKLPKLERVVQSDGSVGWIRLTLPDDLSCLTENLLCLREARLLVEPSAHDSVQLNTDEYAEHIRRTLFPKADPQGSCRSIINDLIATQMNRLKFDHFIHLVTSLTTLDLRNKQFTLQFDQPEVIPVQFIILGNGSLYLESNFDSEEDVNQTDLSDLAKLLSSYPPVSRITISANLLDSLLSKIEESTAQELEIMMDRSNVFQLYNVFQPFLNSNVRRLRVEPIDMPIYDVAGFMENVTRVLERIQGEMNEDDNDDDDDDDGNGNNNPVPPVHSITDRAVELYMPIQPHHIHLLHQCFPNATTLGVAICGPSSGAAFQEMLTWPNLTTIIQYHPPDSYDMTRAIHGDSYQEANKTILIRPLIATRDSYCPSRPSQ
jgi:hypothetical protein